MAGEHLVSEVTLSRWRREVRELIEAGEEVAGYADLKPDRRELVERAINRWDAARAVMERAS